jgi:acetyl-CoA acetyltransferase
MADFTSSRAFRVAGPTAFAEACITRNDVDHLMIYDAFAHLPIYGLEDLGFVPRGEAGAFIAEAQHHPRRQAAARHQWLRPLLYAFGHVRHVRIARERALDAAHRPPQITGAKISVCHCVGGMFAASGTIIMSNETP